jgi:hypothetical protein
MRVSVITVGGASRIPLSPTRVAPVTDATHPSYDLSEVDREGQESS